LFLEGVNMKASYILEQGGPEVFRYGDLPDPVAGEGEVVIDVFAASVNGADWKVRSGSYNIISDFPYILGRDFSGVISEVGPNVDGFRVGDKVFGVCDVGQEGAYAEKISVKASIIAKKPDTITHHEAVALALTGLTAIISIEETLKLGSGEKVLITGGAGGVASLAIQISKNIGAYVLTTTSAPNKDYVRSLGADVTIDYRNDEFDKIAKDCDALFETVGGDVATTASNKLRKGGRAAFIASGPEAPRLDRKDIVLLRPNVGRDRHFLERVLTLYERGAIRLPEIKTFDLSESEAAHRISEGRHFRGKLILLTR
jgi:NADPH:quinone reductase-like Zn-dependent oxidoreductase